MTSNIGANVIQDNFAEMTDVNREEIIAKTKTAVFEVLKKTIRPEFLNRIDELIMFTPLSREEVREIVDLQFKGIQKVLQEMGITLNATEEALDWLGELGYDPQFGARPLKRVMQKRILNDLSKQILADKVIKDAEIMLKLSPKKEFIFENIAV
jgi:ATP-dependent Clp protease ATP-binding subunit ClpB